MRRLIAISFRLNVRHVLRHRHTMHAYLRMIVLAHDRLRFETDRSITKRRAL